MDLKKTKILLEKINALHKSMGTDANNIAAIEKDLMRNYIQQFYEAFLADVPASPTIPKPTPAIEIIKSTSSTQRITKPSPPKVEVPEPEVIRPKPKPAAKKPYTPPRIIDLPDSLKELTETAPPPPPPKPKPKPAPAAVASPPPPPPPPAPERVSAKTDVSEEMEELFELPKAKELSDKLSNLPIHDLTKAMGLNEKIFTINELFGGDQAAFDSAVTMMNKLDNFEQAKAYLLENVAVQYKWTSRNRKKKARNFIKLVIRRYS